MKTRINHALTGDTIARYFRNLESPSSVLGRKLDRPLSKRLAEFKGRKVGKTYGEGFFSDSVELSSPKAEKAILWRDEEFAFNHTEDHTGWYCDSFQHETVNGGAVELLEFPHVFFESIRYSESDGQPIYLDEFTVTDFSECESEYECDSCREEAGEECANYANRTAEIAGEEAQEENAKWLAERCI